jgi:hypothetical protein
MLGLALHGNNVTINYKKYVESNYFDSIKATYTPMENQDRCERQ